MTLKKSDGFDCETIWNMVGPYLDLESVFNLGALCPTFRSIRKDIYMLAIQFSLSTTSIFPIICIPYYQTSGRHSSVLQVKLDRLESLLNKLKKHQIQSTICCKNYRDFIRLSSSFNRYNQVLLDFRGQTIDIDDYDRIIEAINHTWIIECNISQTNIKNDFIGKFLNILPNLNLQRLNLENNQMDEHMICKLMNILPFTDLKCLKLGSLNVNDSLVVLKEISSNLIKSQLIEFSLGNFLGQENLNEWDMLNDTLLKSNLISLDLSHLDISDIQLIELSRILPNTRIETLLLSSTCIGNEGLKVLINQLPKTRLKHLDLSFNSITDPEILALLAKALPWTQLIDLDICDWNLCHDNWLDFFNSLPNTKLEKLILEIKNMSYDCIKVFSNVLEYTSIHSLTLLINQVDISQDFFISEKVEDIILKLPNTQIKSFQIDFLSLEKNVLDTFSKILPNTVIKELVLIGNHVLPTLTCSQAIKNLTRLVIGGDELFLQDIMGLIDYLKNTLYLSQLSLLYAKIETDLIVLFIHHLKLTRLKYLDISHWNVDCTWLIELIKTGPLTYLKYVELSTDVLSTTDIEILAGCLEDGIITREQVYRFRNLTRKRPLCLNTTDDRLQTFVDTWNYGDKKLEWFVDG
ncbi:hypothetical protein HDV02_003686 [Globomyces sp. JEL0801]|nr:hypothetical protein HDV02_003686 [Globomyces sp. JEL0801]